MESFAGKIAVVTGGGTGMGRELVVQLAAAGAHVATCDIQVNLLDETKARAEAAAPDGTRITTHRCDVSDAASMDAFAAEVVEQHGTDHVNLVFNNAGIGGGGSFIQAGRDEWERTFDICWGGVYNCSRAFLPLLVAADAGHVVNTSSVNGFWASLGPGVSHTAYSAAKHAVKGFTEALRTELLHDRSGIHVTMVQLPAINTPQFDWVRNRMPRRPQPVPPVFQPEVAARAIVRASHEMRREWLVGFPTVKAVWAEKLLPGVADWYLARNGYESQQSAEADDPSRPDNLDAPMPGNFYRPRGRFDAIARPRSAWQVVSRHRRVAAAVVILLLVAVLVAGITR